MTDYFLLIILCSLFCFGWHYSTLYTPKFVLKGLVEVEVIPEKREIAWWFRYYTKDFPVCIRKPLIGCVICMASVYGSLFYWGYVLNSGKIINSETFVLWVVTVVATAGLNRILSQIAQI